MLSDMRYTFVPIKHFLLEDNFVLLSGDAIFFIIQLVHIIYLDKTTKHTDNKSLLPNLSYNSWSFILESRSLGYVSREQYSIVNCYEEWYWHKIIGEMIDMFPY